jgi:hypothetical protein
MDAERVRMTPPMTNDLIERLRGGLVWFPDTDMPDVYATEAAMTEAAAHIEALAERVRELEGALADANIRICAFAGLWAVQYAREFGLPEGQLAATHYDILENAGARMDDFTRVARQARKDKENG